MQITIKKEIFNPVYIPLFKNKSRYLILYGGAGSGKSVFIAQKQLIRMMNETGHRFLNVRKVAKTIRTSQFMLLQDIILQWNVRALFNINKSDMTIKFKPNGNEILHAGLDDREKLKSITGISGIWVEEASELEKKDFTQLDLRLRGSSSNYKQIAVSYNPTEEDLFIRSYFGVDLVTKPGEITQLNDSLVCLRTTYKHNVFLNKHDPEYIAVLENLANQDVTYHKIYAEGEYATPVNIIYKPHTIVQNNQWPKKFEDVIYGLDFGWNVPTALLEIGQIGEPDNLGRGMDLYETEHIYQTHLDGEGLIIMLQDIIPKHERHRPIYCDSAEPDRIEEICGAGFNAIPMSKGQGSVKASIIFSQRFPYFCRKTDINLINERKGYKWQEDKSGNQLDEPVKFKDHLMDCRKGAVFTHYKEILGLDSLEDVVKVNEGMRNREAESEVLSADDRMTAGQEDEW